MPRGYKNDGTKLGFQKGFKPWNYNKKLPLEMRLKIGKSGTGRKHTEESKKKIGIGNKGKVLSEETKKKIREARKKQIITLEHRRKISESGKKARENWIKKDVSLNVAIRGLFDFKVWKLSVFQRDNFTCQMPGCGKRGGNLNAHHIIKFDSIIKLNFIKSVNQAIKCTPLWEIKNGITLCEKCHNLTKNKEIQYEDMFTEINNQSKITHN